MRGGGLRRKGIIILWGILFWRVLLDLHRGEFEFCSREGLVQGAPVCWRFWARGPGYPYDILELGSCPSWQGGNKVWAVFDISSATNNQIDGGISIRPRYFKITYLFYSVIKLIFVDKFNMRMC
jgi:hypothetical protein